MNLSLQELQEINRGLLIRIDFLAKAKIDDPEKRQRTKSEAFREIAISARETVKEEIRRRQEEVAEL